jgi:hypothetical protein
MPGPGCSNDGLEIRAAARVKAQLATRARRVGNQHGRIASAAASCHAGQSFACFALDRLQDFPH